MMARNLTPEAENRRNAVEYTAAGGALLGASAAADGAVALDRKRRGMDGPIKAAAKRKFTRRHAGQVGVKIGGRAAFAAGAPLAAYGSYRLAKPKEATPRMNVKRDVAKPLASGIAMKDLAEAQERRLAKSDLAVVDQKRLVRRKNTGRNLSLAGGTLGLAALGLRAPEVARAATKLKRLNRTPIKQLAAKEPGATKASNTLGIAAIGTGAAGSFNYAAQQKLEAKQFKKSLQSMATEYRNDPYRAAKRTHRHNSFNRDVAAGVTVAGALPLAAVGANRVLESRGLTQVKVPVPAAAVDPLSIGRGKLLKVAGMAPGKVGRFARNPVTIAAAGVAVGGPTLVHNWRQASASRKEVKSLKAQRKVMKSLGMGHIKGIGRVRVLNGEGKDAFRVLDRKDQYRVVPRGRLTWVKDKKATAPAPKKKTPVANPVTHTAPPEKIAREAARRPVAPQQMELPFEKALPSALRSGATGEYAARKVAAHRAGRKASKDVSDFRREHRFHAREVLARAAAADKTAVTAGPFDHGPKIAANMAVVARAQQGEAALAPKRAKALASIQRGKDAKVGKSDRFLRNYGNRISPKAEEGYKHLKAGRNERRRNAALGLGTGALLTGTGASGVLANAPRLRTGRGKVGVASGLGLAALGGLAMTGGVEQARSARRWNGHLKKIKAKGKARAAAGEFGQGRLVEKAAGQKAEGAAQVAAGGAALGLGLSTNRLMNTAEGRWDKKVNGKYDRILSSVPLGETKEQKKARGKAVSEINQQRNQHLGKNPYKRITGAKGRGRIALITAGFAAGAPNIWLGSRKAVEKADKHDVDAFMGGALAGAGAYHGGLYATKRMDRKFAQQIKTGPDFQATERAHRKRHGLVGQTRVGDARWKDYHRTYPKMTALPEGAEGPVRPMPGAKWKRAMSRAQAGKTQVAITAGVAGLTGLAAAKANRKIHPKSERVGKALIPSPVKVGAGLLKPRKPAIRQSYVGTSATGKKFTVRGSVG